MKAGSVSLESESLWKEFFRDRSNWVSTNESSSKNNPTVFVFKHKITQESLRMHNGCNPPWVHKELERKERYFATCHLKFEDDIVASLTACAKCKDLEKGIKLHADILQKRLLEKDMYVSNALISLYVKCGALAQAQQVFDQIYYHDVVSWNSLISGYAQHGNGEGALHCFNLMLRESSSPNAITFVCLLKACGSIRAAQKGKEIHAEIVKESFSQSNVIVGTALVDMYAKCGDHAKAQEAFNQLSAHNVISWNALISGYVQCGRDEEALNFFDQMQQKGFSPNPVTFLCALKACSSIGATDRGRQIHFEIQKEGLIEKNVSIGTALVDMYAKCGVPLKAQEVFDQIHIRDVASWNSLIAAYVQHGYGEEALNCYEQMEHEGLYPDAVTVVALLKACGSIGAVDKGEKVHSEIIRRKLLQKDVMVGTALVDMYAKCGAHGKAQDVFNGLHFHDLVAWNVLLTSYAQLGKDDIILELFNKMILDGIKPDSMTFTIVLNACNHSGLLDKGQFYFEAMISCYGIMPTVEHQGCIIGLYGRAGHFDKVLKLMEKMPTIDYLPMWTTLLGACQKWGNLEMGRLAYENIVRLDEKNVAAYICMSNIYAAAGMQRDVDKVETLRMKNQAWK